jgi:hypothetical protein
MLLPQRGGVYLLENGHDAYLYVDKDVPPKLLEVGGHIYGQSIWVCRHVIVMCRGAANGTLCRLAAQLDQAVQGCAGCAS